MSKFFKLIEEAGEKLDDKHKKMLRNRSYRRGNYINFNDPLDRAIADAENYKRFADIDPEAHQKSKGISGFFRSLIDPSVRKARKFSSEYEKMMSQLEPLKRKQIQQTLKTLQKRRSEDRFTPSDELEDEQND